MSAKGRNSEGLYVADGKWTFKYKDGHGAWKSKSTGIAADVKLKGKAFQFKDDFLKGKVQAAPAPVSTDKPANQLQLMTLREATDRFLQFRKVTKSKSTYDGERIGTKRLIEVFGEDKVLNTFTLADFEDYVVARRKEPSKSTGKEVGPHLINLELQTLKQILQKANLWKPLKDDYQPLPEPKEKIGQVLTDGQIKKLISLADVDDGRFVAFHASLLAYHTGCRSIEIKNLRLEDIHLDGDEPYIEIKRSKSDAGRRTVPLTDVAVWALTKLLDRSKLLGCVEPKHFLLPLNLTKCNYKDDPRRGQRGYDPNCHQESWRTGWRSLRVAAGLPKNFRFHDLRCCAASNLAECGVPVEIGMDILGHTSPEMTRWYQRIQQRAQAKARVALNNYTAGAFQALISPEVLTVQ